jgi:cell shape-determining protein MreC
MLDKSTSSRERSPEAKRQAAYRARLEQRRIAVANRADAALTEVSRLQGEIAQLLDERVRLLSALDNFTKENARLKHENHKLQAELDELDRLLNE